MKRTDDLVSREDVVIEFIKLFGCIQDVSDIDEWADICQTTAHEIPSTKTPTNAPIDLISRADAIEAVEMAIVNNESIHKTLLALPSIETSTIDEKHQLSSETPTNTSTDTISRTDAIEALGEEPEIWTDTDEEWAYHNAWVEHISALKALPSVEAKLAQAEKCEDCIHNDTNKDKITCKECASSKANQGEWIKTVDGNGWDDWYVLKCPFCGATIEDKHYHSWEYNFCPNCGADVRDERSE